MVRLLRNWGTSFAVFVFSLILYTLSLEPTVSFWDCGEFISAAAKLEVCHPPGSPLHMLLGRFFVAVWGMKSAAVVVNMLSAVASAFTVLLLFLTIRLVLTIFESKNSAKVGGYQIAIEGASVVGALTFAVSDSFWFSAVEAEVYALSTLFTAIIFYLSLTLLKDIVPTVRGKRVYLISLLLGISACIHELNLLVIPPVVLVIWFSIYGYSIKNLLKGTLLGLALFVAAYAVVPYFLFFFSKQFELLFVNMFGFMKWSGVLFFLFGFFILSGSIILYAKKKRRTGVEFWLTLSLLFVVGQLIYSIVPIRASQNVPLNTGQPDNIFSFHSYVQRDQYGAPPLLYGPYFNAPVEKIVSGEPHYNYSNGRYEETYYSGKILYSPEFSTFFPRMYSKVPDHRGAYCSWASIPNGALVKKDGSDIPPTFGENFSFFLNYQLGHMYLRYFMWNFVGRQNDIQGHGDLFRGGWITGFNFLDAPRVGDSSLLPSNLIENKGRNLYFLIPFLLGIVGLIILSLKNQHIFWSILFLFILTGVAIAVFLNQTPYQARERDYAFLGSFYVWAIWIGLGCFAILKAIQGYCRSRLWVVVALVLLMLVGPAIVLSENWDDHNRSNRSLARSVAVDYLRSCAPNAILFTYGDNDTFPLWYIQEVEGFRTDVRVVNINYLATGWGISQLRWKNNASEPVALMGSSAFYSMNQAKTFQLGRSSKPVEYIDKHLKEKLMAISSGLNGSPFTLNISQEGLILPSFNSSDDSSFGRQQVWKCSNSSLRIYDLALLDIVASNAKTRPIYFASTVPSGLTLGLATISSWEGNLLRLNPPVNHDSNLSLAIVNLVDSSQVAKSHNGYLDDAYRRFIHNELRLYMQLADSLVEAKRINDAIYVLDSGIKSFGDFCYEWNDVALAYISLYFETGSGSKASSMVESFNVMKFQELEYYKSLSKGGVALARFDIERSEKALNDALSLQRAYDIMKKSKNLSDK